MKKFLIILILATVWLGSNGQTGPVFPYNHPSKEVLHALASGTSIKAYRDREAIVEAAQRVLKDTALYLSEASIDFIFDHLFLEEVYLTERSYLNSGFNLGKNTMDPSIGHKWTGFAWVLRVGSYSSPLIKEDCGNVLQAPVVRTARYVVDNASQNQNQPSDVVQKQTNQVTEFVEPETIEELMTTEIPDDYEEPFTPTDKKNTKKVLKKVLILVGSALFTSAVAVITTKAVKRNNNKTPVVAGEPAKVPMHRGFGR